MASLLVRQLDDELVRLLKERAMAHGRSAEAEHRAILEDALRSQRTGEDLWNALRLDEPVDIQFDNDGIDQSFRPVDFS